MKLPTVEYDGSIYIKRLTVVTQDGVIEKVYYPVFSPDKNIDEVIKWI
jgi:peroxiredoxin